jgi:hypothetical protein
MCHPSFWQIRGLGRWCTSCITRPQEKLVLTEGCKKLEALIDPTELTQALSRILEGSSTAG